MSLTTTTLSSACAATDFSIVVASATGFAAGSYVKIDEEFVRVKSTYSSGTTIPLDGRGLNGTFAEAHPSGANVTVGLGSDFANPSGAVVAPYALAGKARRVVSYSASGAITLPSAGEDVVAILNGTSTLTMTLAAPTQDLDGSLLLIVGNGKSASTVAVAGNNGVGNAGAGYRTLTFQNGGQVSVPLIAANGNWVGLNTPWTGTSTALSIGLS